MVVSSFSSRYKFPQMFQWNVVLLWTAQAIAVAYSPKYPINWHFYWSRLPFWSNSKAYSNHIKFIKRKIFERLDFKAHICQCDLFRKCVFLSRDNVYYTFKIRKINEIHSNHSFMWMKTYSESFKKTHLIFKFVKYHFAVYSEIV